MADEQPRAGAPRSEDGYWWWDELANGGDGAWKPIPHAGTATSGAHHTGTGTASTHAGTGTGSTHAGTATGTMHSSTGTTTGTDSGTTGSTQHHAHQYQAVSFDFDHYPALWRLSQVFPNDDGVVQYLQWLEVDAQILSAEEFRSQKDAFFSDATMATNQAAQAVTEVYGGSPLGLTPATATAAVTAMTQLVTSGGALHDALMQHDRSVQADRLKTEMDRLETEAGTLRQAVSAAAGG